jgi:hypothetical protein
MVQAFGDDTIQGTMVSHQPAFGLLPDTRAWCQAHRTTKTRRDDV